MGAIIDLEIIKTEKDVLAMLDDLLEKRTNEWWDKFYVNRRKQVPFFKNIPDENLISYFDRKLLNGQRALDIGCGNGRNSIYIAKQGFEVKGIDFSKHAIEWAKELSKDQALDIDFLCQSIFDFQDVVESFDFIYDSGCLHHIKPHRRSQYLENVSKYLKPDGYFAMVCFNLKGGANISDYEVYRSGSMQGGLGFQNISLELF